MTTIEVQTPGAFDREVLAAEDPTVVLFWASWCPHCQRFRPIFDAVVEGRDARFAVVWIDEQDNPLWDTYRVNVVPSLAFFRAGSLVARKDGRLGRGLTQQELETFLDEVLSAPHAG